VNTWKSSTSVCTPSSADDLGTQRLLKLDGFRAAYIWIQRKIGCPMTASSVPGIRDARFHATLVRLSLFSHPAGELIELHLNGGLQEPQLQKQLPRHRRRFGKTKYRREKIRQVR